MRIAVLVLFFVALISGALVIHAFQQKQVMAAGGARTPVLVELFTSEGCSSCPPVDKLAAHLQSQQPIVNVQVVLLSFHVDYWDQLGWHDRFSSHEYTERQQHYSALFSENEVYTPEVIVDGKEGRAWTLAQEVESAASHAKSVSVEVAPRAARVVSVSAKGDVKSDARVLVAIAEDGLSTSVGGGENGGHKLEHSGVVRKLLTLGKLEKGGFEKDYTIPLDPQWQTGKLMLVSFVQDEKSGRVLGDRKSTRLNSSHR